ncbi:HAD-IC family P-type ATPase [endosymbiont of unidentified scaly snail isolate Monju]|uniref:HAD-IC family P-type ATPase n=1 Tax=endosymbiont of unidentified scaly snail isolate Monju TaxID=1248727 RepID=UPI0003892CBA|nr:HAD-IC family P-type ATPase [endosymbiont of unidentified scaly snail isolate Monju]BAN70234.1 Ca2+-transporting ATPase [endosymbiont of unidentified scaly snail isolate Monju]
MIFGIVVINALIGFVQEHRAELAMRALSRLLSPRATVLRDGHFRELPAEKLVPGDIVQLMAGDRVPADLRLLQARELRIDESLLTGESQAADKQSEPVLSGMSLGDRYNMAHAGTSVVAGQGLGIVAATGEQTEIGHISGLLAKVQPLTTPLVRQIQQLGRVLTIGILGVAGLFLALGIFLHGQPPGEVFLAAVALAVAAIPEGLPAIITATLALGVQRMTQRKVVIRNLPAVETLSEVSVICSDKTGTLTRNEMTVLRAETIRNRYQVSGTGYVPHGGFEDATGPVSPPTHPELLELLRAGLLCNDASLDHDAEGWIWRGDPTEIALLTAALKAGFDLHRERARWPRLDVLPFDSHNGLMATLHQGPDDRARVFVKGAPEIVFRRCTQLADATPFESPAWEARLHALARNGYRVLALAQRAFDSDERHLDLEELQDLQLLGLIGLIDPPREEAIAAVAECRQAGIRVKMITGDHAVTAAAIGRTLGIGDGDRAVGGEQIEQADQHHLRALALDVDIFARTSPEQKLRLVEALQDAQKTVAMTGDGINDAPALKRADVGIAMGCKGTETAREAADMVLVDDNFASIVAGIEEGRTIYDNIRKAILFILPTNGAEALILILAMALGQVLPLSPVQILWVDMVTAVTLAVALAFEPAEPDIMRRPPRARSERLLDAFLLWRVLFVSTLLLIYSYGLFAWWLEQGVSLELARTIAVNALVGGEIAYLFNSRFLAASSLSRSGLLGSRAALAAVAMVSLLQFAFTDLAPLQRLFASVTLDGAHWLSILGGGVAVFLIVEAEKALLRRFRAPFSRG